MCTWATRWSSTTAGGTATTPGSSGTGSDDRAEREDLGLRRPNYGAFGQFTVVAGAPMHARPITCPGRRRRRHARRHDRLPDALRLVREHGGGGRRRAGVGRRRRPRNAGDPARRPRRRHPDRRRLERREGQQYDDSSAGVDRRPAKGSVSVQYRNWISSTKCSASSGTSGFSGRGRVGQGTFFSQMGYRINIESAFLQSLISVVFRNGGRAAAGPAAVARLLSVRGVEAVAGLTTFLVAVLTYNALDTYPGITCLVVLIVICGASARFTEGGPPSHPAAESQRVPGASGRLPSTKLAIRSRETVRGSS